MIAHPIPKPRLKDNPSLTGKEKTGRNGKAPVAQKTVMVRGIRRRSLLRAEYIAMLRACDAFSFLHRAVSRYFRLFLMQRYGDTGCKYRCAPRGLLHKSDGNLPQIT